MPSGLLADLVLLVHLAFIVFAALGALAALAWRWAPLLHLPAAAWGAYVELTGGTCPLTPLESSLRGASGEPGYTGGFIEHHLTAVIYPSGLSSRTQLVLGTALVVLNVALYAWVFLRRRGIMDRGARRSEPPEKGAAMKRLDSDLWVAEQPLRFAGLELGARMTVVRLPGARLLLHSPIRPTPELVREVRALGSVAAIVAPNRFHHLFAGEWLEGHSGTRLFVAPGLEVKRSDLPIAGVLTDEPDPVWKGVVDQVVLRGFPLSNEVVFFHQPTATLIAADLAFNVGRESPSLTRLAFRFSGAYGRLTPTLLERLLVRDRSAFRASLERILEWRFERVIVAHGTVLERGGHDALARGYSWLL